MIRKLREIFSIPDLRKKIFFTLSLLVVYRFGSVIPTPGIDGNALALFFGTVSGGGNSLLGVLNLFSGGAMQRCTIFALGIMPYISASIILQLLTVVVPRLERMSKEGEVGRRKITQYTRYGTVVLSLVQSLLIAIWLENASNFQGYLVVPDPGMLFRFTTVVTLTAGTAFIMWLGEQITEKGIGNGISLIIGAGIMARAPFALAQMWELLSPFDIARRQLTPFFAFVMLVLFFFVIIAVIYLLQGQRRIPIQYVKRVAGRGVSSSQNSFLPLRLNQAGVIPMIFASSVLMFPSTMSTLVSTPWLKTMASWFQYGKTPYLCVEALLIIFFTFFYTAITFNPVEVSENLKRNGGSIPGVRLGRETSDMLDHVLVRITTAGALFLAIIAILPGVVYAYARIPFDIANFFGGTGLLIVVGVLLETAKKIESHLFARHYDGFLRKGRIRGRY